MIRSLARARECCERFHPGLLDDLERLPLPEREADGSSVAALYRRHGGPGLVVPTAFGGGGASLLEAVMVQRAVSALSPSLGVIGAMHHFTVAMLFALARTADRLTPAQHKTLESIAADGLFLASGWAEGCTDQNIVLPSVVARQTEDGYVVNGSKKPCSIARSMDVLTASVALSDAGGESDLALLLIPAGSPGISVHPFWASPVLAAAESHEVRLTDVRVPHEMVIRTTPEDRGRLDDLQTHGFTWFELLASAAYLGATSALVDRVCTMRRGTPADRARLGVTAEAAVLLLEGTAASVDGGLAGDAAVGAALTARYALQDLLAQASDAASELLGGLAFMSSSDVSYLLAAVRALPFHPPSRASVAAAMADWFDGGPLLLS